MNAHIGVLVLTAAVGSASPPSSPASLPAKVITTTLVLPFEPQQGVSRDTAEIVTATLATEAESIDGVKVITAKEIEVTLSREQLLVASGCNQTSCATEVARALNADELLLGTVGKVGDTWVLAVTRIQARTAVVVSRGSMHGEGREDELLKGIPAVVRSLYPAAGPAALAGAAALPPPAASSTPTSDGIPEGGPRPLPWVLRGASTALVGLSVLLTAGALVLGSVPLVAVAYDATHGGRPGRHYVTPPMAIAADLVAVVTLTVAVAGVGPAAAALALLVVSKVVP